MKGSERRRSALRPTIVQLTTVHRVDDVRICWRMAATAAGMGCRSIVVGPSSAVPEQAPAAVEFVVVSPVRSRLTRMTVGIPRAVRAAIRARPDIVHLHDPELLIAVPLLAMLGIAVVYDAHEDYSAALLNRDWIHARGRRFAARLLGVAERTGARFASRVIVATPAIGRRFSDAAVIQNFPDLSDSTQGSTSAIDADANVDGVFRLVFVGELNERRGAVQMAEAMGRLHQRPIELVVAGEVKPEQLRSRLVDVSRGSMRFVGWIPHSEISDLLRSASVGIVTFLPGPNHDESQPRKLFEYMSAGLPVVASDLPRWREIVAGHECGVLVDPLDPSAIADAIEGLWLDSDLRERLGRNGRTAAAHFSWESQQTVLSAVYSELLKTK